MRITIERLSLFLINTLKNSFLLIITIMPVIIEMSIDMFATAVEINIKKNVKHSCNHIFFHL